MQSAHPVATGATFHMKLFTARNWTLFFLFEQQQIIDVAIRTHTYKALGISTRPQGRPQVTYRKSETF